MSLTGGVVTLRALCQEWDEVGPSRGGCSSGTQDFAFLHCLVDGGSAAVMLVWA
ncbi:MAG: hypothetical protein IKX56_06135 [Muribaculaceae bacterium]|nr:hypothetical protein [Muribaculaceae bacterium]